MGQFALCFAVRLLGRPMQGVLNRFCLLPSSRSRSSRTPASRPCSSPELSNICVLVCACPPISPIVLWEPLPTMCSLCFSAKSSSPFRMPFLVVGAAFFSSFESSHPCPSAFSVVDSKGSASSCPFATISSAAFLAVKFTPFFALRPSKWSSRSALVALTRGANALVLRRSTAPSSNLMIT